MSRRGLEELVVARIISLTWLLNFKQKVSRISLCGSTGAPVSVFRGGRYGIFGNISIKKSPNKIPKSSGYFQ